MTRSMATTVGIGVALVAVLGSILLFRIADRGDDARPAHTPAPPQATDKLAEAPAAHVPSVPRLDDEALLKRLMPKPPDEEELRHIEWLAMTAREAEKRQSAIQAETLEQCVANLMFTESFEDIRLYDFDFMSDPDGAVELVKSDLRMQKLFDAKESRGDEGRQQIREAIIKGAEHYIDELPMSKEEGETTFFGQTVISSPGVAAAAIILAEIDGSAESLALIVRMHERYQTAAKERRRGRRPAADEYIFSIDGVMFAGAEDVILSGMLAEREKTVDGGRELDGALAEYHSMKKLQPNQEVVLGLAKSVVRELGIKGGLE